MVRSQLSNGNGASHEPLRAFVATEGQRNVVVQADAIISVEAAANYVRVRHSDGTAVARGKISTLEARLDPTRFVRVHRSWIVGVRSIAEVRRSPRTELVLRDGARVPVGGAYRRQLMERLRLT